MKKIFWVTLAITMLLTGSALAASNNTTAKSTPDILACYFANSDYEVKDVTMSLLLQELTKKNYRVADVSNMSYSEIRRLEGSGQKEMLLKIKNDTGAKFLLRLSLDSLSNWAEDGDSSLIATLLGQKVKAAMSLRVIDTETGNIIYAGHKNNSAVNRDKVLRLVIEDLVADMGKYLPMKTQTK